MEAWNTTQQALIITAIGIVLVFAVLFIMWGLMAALVRVTTPRPRSTDALPQDAEAVDTAHATRACAAVVAVAVALAIETEHSATAPLLQPTQGPISPWQATIRGNALSRRASAFRRNPPPR